jgi:hypothetical protein
MAGPQMGGAIILSEYRKTAIIDSYHSLCLDKKDIISAEIEACQRLSKYTVDEKDKLVIETELAELKMSLDLMN